MKHPLRFGVITLQDQPWVRMVENWKLIEQLKFDSVWIADHFVNPHQIDEDWFDGWTMLSALAGYTSSIRIGTLVSNIILRNPATLAKQALTLDHISQGRLELGIGATSTGDPSHRMTGVKVWNTRERLQRFREVVEIVDSMLRNEITTYQGQYYSIQEAYMKPSPIQKPRPPITLAAIGEKTLQIAARYAETWNTFGGWNLSSEQNVNLLHERNALLDNYCAQIGRNPDEVRRSFLIGLSQDTPFASLNAFQDLVSRLVEVGMTEFIVYYDYPLLPKDKVPDRAMLERIATEAIPALKAEYLP